MINFVRFKYRSARSWGFDWGTGDWSLGLLGFSITTFSSATTTGLDAVAPVGTITALSGTARSERPATIGGPDLVFLIIVLAALRRKSTSR